MSARTLKRFQEKLQTFPAGKRDKRRGPAHCADRRAVPARLRPAEESSRALIPQAVLAPELTNRYAHRQATVSATALLCRSEVVEVIAYIVQLPRGDIRRFGMFSSIVVQSEEIPRIVSMQPGYAVRLMRAETLMAAVMGQMFPTWRIERLTETTCRPSSGRPVLLDPPILALEEDPVVATGPAGHVDRNADRPIQR
jgi:hypothetical protein